MDKEPSCAYDSKCELSGVESVLRVCSVLFDDRVETEISVCLETQKLLSQGPLIGQVWKGMSLDAQGGGSLLYGLKTIETYGCGRLDDP